MILLFDSIQAAQEIAYMLYGQWDGCNGVIISSKVDMAAIQFAANLVDAKWCLSKEQCMLLSFANNKHLIKLILKLVNILFAISLLIGMTLSFGNNGQHKSNSIMHWMNQSLIK